MVDPGIPSYVGVTGPPNGYVEPGYQQYYSSDPHALPGTLAGQGVIPGTVPNPVNWPALPPTLPPIGCPPLASVWSAGVGGHPSEEIGYTPPAAQPNDDGVTFPVSPGSVMLRNQWHGVPSTINPLNIELMNLQLAQAIHDAIASLNPQTIGTPGVSQITITYPDAFTYQNAIQQAIVKAQLQGSNLWYELVLKPLTNGPFTNFYSIQTTDLAIEQTIDLSAPSI